LNYQFTPVGGCQQQVKTGQEILWAFDAFNKSYFLKLSGAPLAAKLGQPVTVTVTDGTSGVAIRGALISVKGDTVTATSDASGKATLTFSKKGIKTLKASRDDSIRSNAQVVIVA
jgi:hypothetical protein